MVQDHKSRLSTEDWLDHGLKALAEGGAEALKADRLARSLKVSRGSFYWHFADLAAFHAALLDRWRDRTTDQVIETIASRGDARAQLTWLLNRAFALDVRLERAIRSWAVSSPHAAAALHDVDERRLGFLAILMKDRPFAEARARMLYWSFVGRVMAPSPRPDLSAEEIEGVAAMFLPGATTQNAPAG